MKFSTMVTAIITDESGNVIHTQKGHNTIANGDPDSVFNGFVFTLLKLFDSGQDLVYYDSSDFIDQMDIGTGTPSNSGIGAAYSPSKKKTIDSSVHLTIDKSNPAEPTITISMPWGAESGALSGITEVVLLNSSGELFSYKALTPALAKTAGATMTINWVITLSV